MVASPDVSLQSDALETSVTAMPGGGEVVVGTALDVSAGSQVGAVLAGMPAAGSQPAEGSMGSTVASSALAGVTEWLAMGALALAALGCIGAASYPMWGARSVGKRRRKRAQQTRDEAVQELADLESLRAAGRISASDYASRRAELVSVVVSIAADDERTAEDRSV
jgi:hypothetical protein